MSEHDYRTESGSNCLLRYIPFADYLEIPALSSSVIKNYGKSMKHGRLCETGVIGLGSGKPKPKYVEVGSIVDDWLMEMRPIEESLAYYPGKMRKGPAWRQFVAENPGKVCALESWRDDIEKAIAGCSQAVIENPEAAGIISNARRQVSGLIVPRGTKTQCKFRLDMVTAGEGCFDVSDLKTTADATAGICGKVAANLGYKIQLANYATWYSMLSGLKIRDVRIIWLDMTDFDCVIDPVFRSGNSDHDDLVDQYARSIDIIQRREKCLETNVWPGMGNRKVISTPMWSVGDEESDEVKGLE